MLQAPRLIAECNANGNNGIGRDLTAFLRLFVEIDANYGRNANSSINPEMGPTITPITPQLVDTLRRQILKSFESFDAAQISHILAPGFGVDSSEILQKNTDNSENQILHNVFLFFSHNLPVDPSSDPESASNMPLQRRKTVAGRIVGGTQNKRRNRHSVTARAKHSTESEDLELTQKKKYQRLTGRLNTKLFSHMFRPTSQCNNGEELYLLLHTSANYSEHRFVEYGERVSSGENNDNNNLAELVSVLLNRFFEPSVAQSVTSRSKNPLTAGLTTTKSTNTVGTGSVPSNKPVLEHCLQNSSPWDIARGLNSVARILAQTCSSLTPSDSDGDKNKWVQQIQTNCLRMRRDMVRRLLELSSVENQPYTTKQLATLFRAAGQIEVSERQIGSNLSKMSIEDTIAFKKLLLTLVKTTKLKYQKAPLRTIWRAAGQLGFTDEVEITTQAKDAEEAEAKDVRSKTSSFQSVVGNEQSIIEKLKSL